MVVIPWADVRLTGVLAGGSVMKILFLDESGDHNLDVIDPAYPVFVLGGVIVDSAHLETVISPRLETLKADLFGRTSIILHTADMARNRNGFEGLKDGGFRETVYVRINEFMTVADYKVVACAILKDDHLRRYGASALDPYMFALEVLVERFCYEIGGASSGAIVAEKRGPALDRQLELAWENLKLNGTRYVAAKDVRKRIVTLESVDKQANLAGLQLADLVVSPIGRAVLGKRTHRDYEIIAAKYRRDRTGKVEGPGLVILPKNGKGPAPATQ